MLPGIDVHGAVQVVRDVQHAARARECVASRAILTQQQAAACCEKWLLLSSVEACFTSLCAILQLTQKHDWLRKIQHLSVVLAVGTDKRSPEMSC